MRIIIEEHQYPAEAVKDVLAGITSLQDIDGKISVNYVGYYYNTKLEDTVFILPKVLLGKLLDENGNILDSKEEFIFGKYKPEDIIDVDHQQILTKAEHDFIYELSVWIYRAIVVFRDSKKDSSIVLQQNVQQMSKGRLKKSNTFLDILLALQKFNKDNQNFFFFILRNIHSGFNKINWNRTISHSQAIIENDSPIYLNPVNKKRIVNFDEELLVIFFSMLQYINKHYGFPVQINVNIPLIPDGMFASYMKGMGKTRLMQIKYKYFSDKAIYLWELCYAFFDQSKKINVETDEKEYLLVRNFNIVFEAIIDELVGDKIPEKDKRLRELKEQPDGKMVDHIFQWQNLANNADEDCSVYYIGDSKYYKRGHAIGKESVYKQFTYARNVIQWNLDLFNDGSPDEQLGHVKLRDEVTEGYNIIPNFFISAQQNTLERIDDIHLTDNNEKYFFSRQFENRLFDRDTFLIAHYDVNFLFIVALYGRDNTSEKAGWKKRVRDMFRKQIQEMLKQKFNFYVMTAKEGVSSVNYLEEHFQQLLGKVFSPYKDREQQKYYALALDKREEYDDENATILAQLKDSFHVVQCVIGDNPEDILPKVDAFSSKMAVQNNYLTMHHLERYIDKSIVIGCYHDQAHLDWILGKNDRGTLIYNIRLGSDRAGGQKKSYLDGLAVSFAILYEEGHESENKYRVFRVHHHATMTAERLKQSLYPNEPKSKKYFCYVFDEEVTLGNININGKISHERVYNKEFVDGMPIFVKGDDLIGYRR